MKNSIANQKDDDKKYLTICSENWHNYWQVLNSSKQALQK